MDDLHCGLLPADAADLSALEAWDICYKHMVEFVAVDYDQEHPSIRTLVRRFGSFAFSPPLGKGGRTEKYL